MALTPLGRRLIGVDDFANQLAAHHVAPGEGDIGDVVDAFYLAGAWPDDQLRAQVAAAILAVAR